MGRPVEAPPHWWTPVRSTEGSGKVSNEAAEVSRLRRENDRPRMERDILKNCGHLLWNPRNEVPPDRGSSGGLAGARHVRCAERIAVRLLRLAVAAGEPAQDRQSWAPGRYFLGLRPPPRTI